MKGKGYYIRINDALIEVTKEQYLCYYHFERRMRYFEVDLKIEITVRDDDGDIIGFLPSKEDSLDRILSTGKDFADIRVSVADSVIRNLASAKLNEALGKLSKGERELIEALFFSNDGEGMSEREYELISGIPNSTIHSRKAHILAKLRKLLKH